MSINDFIKIALNSLDKAVKFEKESKFTESLAWYEEGLQILISIQKMPGCEKVFPDIRKHTSDFMDKAELLKRLIDKENSLDLLKLTPGEHQQIRIEKDSTGHGYSSIFNKFLQHGDVEEVIIEDPYIRDPHQISNFVNFCEMLLKSRSKVRQVKLITSTDRPRCQSQTEALDQLKFNMHRNGLELTVTYNDNLHDREIRFSNGWIVKIGRGLDYFRRLPNTNMIGVHDFDFRLCLETTVDIFHKNTIPNKG